MTDAAFGGDAIGHLTDGRVVFAARGLPGEQALVAVQEERRDFVRGDVVSLERSARGRIEPPCTHYREGCGGCSWQHADYALQLQLKQSIVVEQLRRIGRFPDAEELVRPPLAMLEPWHYRNQARFTVGRRFGELCFTYRASHRLLRVEHCWIVHPHINTALEVMQGRLADLGRRIHQVSVRVGANTGQVLISPALPEVPELETGQPHLEEELLGRRFRLEPPSFFQVNTLREKREVPATVRRTWLPLPDDGVSMAELLALLVLDRLEPSESDVVVDAYSGVGTFALLLSPLVREAIGIEEARSAIRDAEHNAREVDNVRFIQAKTEEALPALDVRPDAVVLDPARVGCHPGVLRALLDVRPPRIVYVSCDPSTLARDLRILVDGGFKLHEVQPLDMFPQTYHIECVATLSG
ncbi:MAG: class I SAM-dependent RNA methyltransferase [Chloroflexi bacterium]|nr:class I SAM-dependent RNA methyltransferase [Chloroflexota bacterium]